MERKNVPENTTRSVQNNPLAALVEYGSAGSIERSERRGQEQLVASEVLPVDTAYDDDASFVALGFTFGEPVEGDPLFRRATLPPGWTRKASDHAMWSYIVDERGIVRVKVFYKAAFYDRRADMHIVNVGRETATNAIYGDEAPTTESMRLATLTESEMDELRADLRKWRKNIAESPDILGKHAERLALCEAIVASATGREEPDHG